MSELPNNLIQIEFENEGSVGISNMFISPNVTPLQMIALGHYLILMAEETLKNLAQKQAIIETDKQILTPKH